VIALVAPKLEESLLESLHDEKVLVVPFVSVLVEKPSKCFLRCPLNTNPF
jgi:hypothetical protein